MATEQVVELQWSLCEKSAATFFQKVQITTPSENRRKVYYRETEDLELYTSDSFIRTRFEKNEFKRAVKIKYAQSADIPWALMNDLGADCEKDTYGTQFKWGCSYKTKPDAATMPLTPAEESLLVQEAGFQDFGSLQNWGPVDSSEWKFSSQRMDLVLETLKAPGNYFSMELSAKVKLSEESRTAEELAKWIRTKKLILCPVQQGKTGELLKILVKTRSQVTE